MQIKNRRSDRRRRQSNLNLDDPSFDYESTLSFQDSRNHLPNGGRSQQDDTYGIDVLSHLTTNGDEGRYMRYATSADSMLALLESKRFKSKLMSESSQSMQEPSSQHPKNTLIGYSDQAPYSSWGPDDAVPATATDIERQFEAIARKLGFQRDNVRNIFDHLMVMLDSRASRMKPQQALDTLHADYIGGENANYRQWYFAAQMDLIDANEKLLADDEDDQAIRLEKSYERWKIHMRSLSNEEKIRDLALYLLIWGEAAVVRYTPEALCFLFKICSDYYNGGDCVDAEEGSFLDNIIQPLYNFFRDEIYETVNGKLIKLEKDHDKIIGYDDVNQFFWSPTCMTRIYLSKTTTLQSLAPNQRFAALKDVDWKRTLKKTYKEKRTWMHASINFSRIWIIHIVSFWYYISANAPALYLTDDKEIADMEGSVQWSIVALGGAIAVVLMLIGSFCEYSYLPLNWANTKHISRRIVLLFILLIINAGPTVYCVFIDRTSHISKLVAVIQLLVSVATTLFLAITPTSKLFVRRKDNVRAELAAKNFTANFPPLKRIDRIMSIALWVFVFTCKLLESYFFLALSFKDPLKVMSKMHIENCSDAIIGERLCGAMPDITLALMFFMDLLLYFLDTYLWYIIWNTIFSVARSFYLGISIWSPWRNIFSQLPKRIFVKLLATSDIQIKYKPKVLCSQIWNAIVITMYREHLITVDHVQRMLYQQETNPVDGRRTLKPPTFFVSQEDTAFKAEYYPQHSEAERRIHFFAQSLTTPMPQPRPVECMPTFTVLTPHYGEKILLSLREIIREEDQNTRVTLLEYLKQLHPVEWENFVKDTKIMVDESGVNEVDGRGSMLSDVTEKNSDKSKIDDLPFYCIGFKSAKPEYTLRTRIWASLRAQTLFRTVSGFMNYRKAIKLLYRVENPDTIHSYQNNTDGLERDLDNLSHRKFRFLVAMQRYARFSAEETEDTEMLFRAWPNLEVAYIEEEPPAKEGDPVTFYSCLIDGQSELMENNKRKPKYRLRLPGTPIIGDGKSDNQNHALIFYRGEFLQLIDANQDNYLEECLKIRNILGEFENLGPTEVSPYSSSYKVKGGAPVAIVGAREYIFSENIGILGDVAAGKEQTFGTLTQRIMAKIGGKLHYGHPDFLNAVFMTTRGGVSKAQKGLHLNEDIYAGMNAFTRGGRIKHTEYFQCGKGRDLGFGSILNFTTKIGTGMGEQMLSREYYYIGTQLPLDRFLTFYYAHPGFHINNIFIMLSVQMFMLVLLFIGAMGATLTICEFNADAPPDAPLTPEGCYNLVPIFEWVKRCILSIFVVFFVSFLPLFLQELTERGFWRSITRLGRHFMSLSPLFEIFVTQIYMNSVIENLIYGGAQYIATGRGFATSRQPFSLLYSRFSESSIYSGARAFLIMLFASMAVWIPHLTYFWFTVVALIVSPFIFNPNQFSLVDFLVDYREFIRWMSRGNSKTHKNSWINHCRMSRSRITGYKRPHHKKDAVATTVGDLPRARIGAIFFSEIILPFLYAILCLIPYMFVKSFDPEDSNQPNTGKSGLIRIGIISLAPIFMNAGALILFFFISLFLGSVLSLCCAKFGSVMAALVHGWAVINLILMFEGLMFLENFKVTSIVLGLISMVALQRFVLRVLTVLFLTREFKHDEANRGWWTGKWYGRGLGWHAVSQPLREYLCKVVEMSEFATDFILGHMILFTLSIFCLIPYIDTAHSLMLFWLRPSKQIRPPIWTFRQRKKRRRIAITYGFLFLAMFLLFSALIAGPLAVGPMIGIINPKKIPL
ncbi:1,3-beta-glucan synthase component-domain-containing protein [Dichotomocladium elegans]|nr:1,3-beta-glucan synthase component-domain-containing protein [Dichotomocladium elegans]